jgi:hypothetical protein
VGRFWVCVLTLGLAACSTPAFHDAGQRDEALASFRSGRAALACGNGINCMFNWTSSKAAAEQFAQREQWDNLAESVLATGYDIDLTWFYLGLAAQGLKYDSAARIYYETSLRRNTAGGLSTCLSACGPVNLPADAQRMMADLRSGPTLSSAQPSRPAKATPAASTTTAKTTNWQTPSTSSAQPAGQWVDPSASPQAASTPAAGGWVAPPPAPQH